MTYENPARIVREILHDAGRRPPRRDRPAKTPRRPPRRLAVRAWTIAAAATAAAAAVLYLDWQRQPIGLDQLAVIQALAYRVAGGDPDRAETILHRAARDRGRAGPDGIAQGDYRAVVRDLSVRLFVRPPPSATAPAAAAPTAADRRRPHMDNGAESTPGGTRP